MVQKNKKTDDYILKSADFAKPILMHLREVVHKACPDAIEEWKWSFPVFMYKGSILCNMAAFKQHCAFGFWLGPVMKDPHKLLVAHEEKAGMGHFGMIKKVSDLPSDKILIEYIKQAMDLTDKGVKAPKKTAAPETKELIVPEYLTDALKKNAAARKTFENFSNTNKKDYLEWLAEAKTETTRLKRLETAIEWMSEGKIRNWKYVK